MLPQLNLFGDRTILGIAEGRDSDRPLFNYFWAIEYLFVTESSQKSPYASQKPKRIRLSVNKKYMGATLTQLKLHFELGIALWGAINVRLSPEP